MSFVGSFFFFFWGIVFGVVDDWIGGFCDLYVFLPLYAQNLGSFRWAMSSLLRCIFLLVKCEGLHRRSYGSVLKFPSGEDLEMGPWDFGASGGNFGKGYFCCVFFSICFVILSNLFFSALKLRIYFWKFSYKIDAISNGSVRFFSFSLKF